MKRRMLAGAVALCLTATQAYGAEADTQTVVCPSPEPLMKDICGAAEHSAKMFTALRAGEMEAMAQEARLARVDMRAYGSLLVYMADYMTAEAKRQGAVP